MADTNRPKISKILIDDGPQFVNQFHTEPVAFGEAETLVNALNAKGDDEFTYVVERADGGLARVGVMTHDELFVGYVEA